jgi:sugar phosphate isomerase/epimerase
MTMNKPLITVGAAMRSQRLPEYVSWLIDGQRDLEIQDPAWPDYLDTNWKANTTEIQSMLDGHTGRRGIHGPFFSLPLDAIDSKIRAVVQDRFMRALDYCAALGGTHMVVHSPFNYLGTPFQPLTPAKDGFPHLMFIHNTMDEVVKHAESLNITIMIENIFDRDPSILVEAVRSFNSPNVRVSTDVGHAFVMSRVGAPPPDYFVREAGALSGHLHLQDTDGFADRHWVPGEGDVKWAPIFKALYDLDHTPRLIIEIADQGRICDAANFFEAHGWAK